MTFVILQMIDSSESSFFFSSGFFSRSGRPYCFNHVQNPNILIVLSDLVYVFSTSCNNFFNLVSAISAAYKSFSFKSGNSPILLWTKFLCYFLSRKWIKNPLLWIMKTLFKFVKLFTFIIITLCICVLTFGIRLWYTICCQLLSLRLGIQEQLLRHP